MKIGVISDTHRKITKTKKALDMLSFCPKKIIFFRYGVLKNLDKEELKELRCD